MMYLDKMFIIRFFLSYVAPGQDVIFHILSSSWTICPFFFFLAIFLERFLAKLVSAQYYASRKWLKKKRVWDVRLSCAVVSAVVFHGEVGGSSPARSAPVNQNGYSSLSRAGEDKGARCIQWRDHHLVCHHIGTNTTSLRCLYVKPGLHFYLSIPFTDDELYI